MASRIFSRYLLSKPFSASLLPRPSPPSFTFQRLRPLLSAAAAAQSPGVPSIGVRCFSVRRTTSSLNDPSPNWSNRPPKETILLDGCDFEHWLVVMEKPEGDPTRDEIIDSYIKTLAQIFGSEEEARMKIYSVSTRCYYAFGALVSEELSYKIKELPKVRWVLPDSYLDVKNKDYGGEPFINGQAVPYDPKYHAEWIRNNSRANERNRRNDRPRNFDRSRNFERRQQEVQYTAPNSNVPPPPSGNVPPPSSGNMPPPPSGNMPPSPSGYVPPVQNPSAPGMPQHSSFGGMQQGNNMGGMPYNNRPAMNNPGGMAPNTGGMQPPYRPQMSSGGGFSPNADRPELNNAGSRSPNMGGAPAANVGWSNNTQGFTPMPNYAPNNAGWTGDVPGPNPGNFSNFQNRDAPNSSNTNYHNRANQAPPNQEFQNNYNPAGTMPGGDNSC